jgi:hypothetical protein
LTRLQQAGFLAAWRLPACRSRPARARFQESEPQTISVFSWLPKSLPDFAPTPRAKLPDQYLCKQLKTFQPKFFSIRFQSRLQLVAIAALCGMNKLRVSSGPDGSIPTAPTNPQQTTRLIVAFINKTDLTTFELSEMVEKREHRRTLDHGKGLREKSGVAQPRITLRRPLGRYPRRCF